MPKTTTAATHDATLTEAHAQLDRVAAALFEGDFITAQRLARHASGHCDDDDDDEDDD